MKFRDNYKCVAVIGCQSSGKSTLLNRLFETKFETMDNTAGRQQTTKGIWMAKSTMDGGDNLNLVFDIEGTDSKERGDQRTTFEQTTSMLALAIADVLIINMWTQDIGRYGASNYGLLEVIFECNLKLFGQ
jgi:predicted GTPase